MAKIIKNLKLIFKLIFYITGIVFTCATIFTAAKKYLQYPSRQVVREGPAQTVFPKLLVCATALHSKARVSEKYPDMVDIIPALYGFNRSVIQADKLRNLSMISLKEWTD